MEWASSFLLFLKKIKINNINKTVYDQQQLLLELCFGLLYVFACNFLTFLPDICCPLTLDFYELGPCGD